MSKISPVAIINGVLNRIRIEVDNYPSDPRENSNLATMVCFHRNYRLGDEQPNNDPSEYRQNLAMSFDDKLEARLDRIDKQYDDWYFNYNARNELREWRKDYAESLKDAVDNVLEKHILELPLYLYAHGGITMSTRAFSCGWDSGQVGFIYMDIRKIKEQMSWGKLTDARRQQCYKIMNSEVQEYDDFITGNMYTFNHEVAKIPEEFALLSLIEANKALEILDRNIDLDSLVWDSLDTCGGFIGDDVETNGMLDNLNKEVHFLAKEAA